MEPASPTVPPLAALAEGRPLPDRIGRALADILGLELSLDGLERFFQPSFPGVRAYVIESRVAPDQAVEIRLVGIARDGRPVWRGRRAFVQGRDGSVEIHRKLDHVDPAYKDRAITVDLVARELELLELTKRGPSSRLTVDAEGPGRYLFALHGYVFADETDEGSPVRSKEPFRPEGDRGLLVEAAVQVLEREGRRLGLGRIAIETAQDQARRATSALDLARASFDGVPNEPVEGAERELGVTRLGREILSAHETPAWRAALYLETRDPRTRAVGDAFRRAKTRVHRESYEAELTRALSGLGSGQRPERIRALESLGMIGRPTDARRIGSLSASEDRRVAGIAKRVGRMLDGSNLVERMMEFASSEEEDPKWRGLVYRVLAEHHPEQLQGQSTLLRIHPDARIQRAVLPVIAAEDQGTADLAAMLAANPSHETRPGLPELRLELLERLAERADPMTLPVILQEHGRSHADPKETLAVSRALVAFNDPRARLALAEASRGQRRPPVP